MQPLRPPLPDVVRNVLGRCRFAYLSTMDLDANSSHLSLMRFTYLAEEEISKLNILCSVLCPYMHALKCLHIVLMYLKFTCFCFCSLPT